MVRISFAVAMLALGITPVLLLAAMIINGPSPLLWALWPVWAVIMIGAALIYRTAKHGLP